MNSDSLSESSRALTWLSLLTSSGTLICCALPILLVALGLGATVAALTSSFPMLIALSEHKDWVFAISGALLLTTAWVTLRSGRACPADAEIAGICQRANVWNRRVLWIAVVIWSIGFFAAFLALPIRIQLGI